jgi:hypothetical protein
MNLLVTYFQESKKFSQGYVQRMKSMCERNCSLPFQFLSLTSSSIPGITSLPPLVQLPGWWGKLSLFTHPEIVAFDNILYLDLDSVVVGSIDELWGMESPSFLGDFYEPRFLATGIMFWKKGDLQEIGGVFARRSESYMREFEYGGDQMFLRYFLKSWNKVQDQVSGIYSYKVDCENGLPEDAKVVCFHGKPWLHEVNEPWIKENWR